MGLMADNNVYRRGFASMTPEQRREIAARGGRRAHARGTAHQWTSETAREAGKKALISRRARAAAERVGRANDPQSK